MRSAPIAFVGAAAELAELLADLHEPVDRVTALSDRYAAGLVDLGLAVAVADATRTPFPGSIWEAAHA